MAMLFGPILPGGAVIDVLVGVSQPRTQLLGRHGFSVPHAIPVRVLIDTGSSLTGFAPRTFRELDLTPVGQTAILTPSTLPTAPHECDLFDVSLALIANGAEHAFGDVTVIGADCWLENEGIEGLIGRDILDQCTFWYVGKERTFTLAFD